MLPYPEQTRLKTAFKRLTKHIDLAAFADKDLSQINFMAMGNDTVFTIKSITFVK